MDDLALLGFWTKKVVAGLVLLPTGPLIAIGIGLWIARRRRAGFGFGLGLALIGLGMTTLVVFALPVVSSALAAGDEREFPPLSVDAVLPADAAIVVLGGGMQDGATDYGGETVNAVTLARLRSAARLAARTHLPILVSGGRPLTDETAEADQMRDALQRDFRTPVRWVEKEALDTPANARLSAPMLKADRIATAILVTDVDHMRRATALFEATGLKVIPAPTDYYANGPISVLSFIPNPNALRRSAWWLHEWLGLLWSRLTG